jgi:hypothetical protein
MDYKFQISDSNFEIGERTETLQSGKGLLEYGI